MANSQLILLEADPHSETYELTTDIFKSTERIQNIVRNLLEFSNQGTYFFVETDLVATLDDALALVTRSFEKINTEILLDYQARPKLSASVSHLKLVWMNLLLNARDAIIDHADQPQITISTEMVSNREVKVVITDNGIGMPEENIEQIYRPFFTTKSIGEALGLGLYSAHTIVEQHNGQINVSSNPGIGTAFEIILPLDNPRDV
jgi:signal transduction histidine kinase